MSQNVLQIRIIHGRQHQALSGPRWALLYAAYGAEESAALHDNKSELRTPLGGDRRAALGAHPMAVAQLMHQITQAERRESEVLGIAVAPGRYPLTDAQIALRSDRERLAQDEAARNQSARYAQVGIDDGYLHNLREGIAGILKACHRYEPSQRVKGAISETP